MDSELIYRDSFNVDDKNNPFIIIHNLAAGYRWRFDDIISLTETQISMLSHAAHVSSKRDENKKEMEKTCPHCLRTELYNNVCNACGFVKPVKIYKDGQAVDSVEWPPGSGNYIYGDGESSALERLKQEDPAGFMAYNTWVMMKGATPTAEEVKRELKLKTGG